MDPNMKDQSLDQRREEALARRLGEALDRVAPRGTEPCPDAELIAAYHERSLAAEEIAECEAHFAACSRCRKILAVLAASDDTPLAETEVARLGELVAAAHTPRKAAPQVIKPARPNLWDWRARWLAPALGVAAVLAVWFAVRPPWRNVDQGASGTLIAQAPKSEPAPNAAPQALDQYSNVPPVKEAKKDSVAPSAGSTDLSVSKTESAKQAPETLARNGLEKRGAVGGLVLGAGVTDNVSEDQKKKSAESAVTSSGEPAAPPAPAAAPAPVESLQAEVQEMARTAPPEPRPAANAPARALAGPMAQAQAMSKTDAITETFMLIPMPSGTAIAGPGPAIPLWRAGKGGRIERSEDTGRTWRPQASPLREDWLSGTPLSNVVCWLVGRNGAIARTTDGEHWVQIASPPMASAASGKLPDWIGITATDAQTATITASDQRRFTTQDGGKTWRAQ